jgi:transposase
MRSASGECERLRRLIAHRKFLRSPLSRELRAQAIAYARHRSSEGATQSAIADELGVSIMSVCRWLRVDNTMGLIPVRVVAEPRTTTATFEVVTPRGLRVTGLDMGALCALLERHG